MNPEGHISGETLTALWRVFPSADSYSLSVERCDQDNQCEQVKELRKTYFLSMINLIVFRCFTSWSPLTPAARKTS